jgi:hypothetical protein
MTTGAKTISGPAPLTTVENFVKEAWYVVDVYCGLCLLGIYAAFRKSGGNPTLLIITVAISSVILLLTWRTYRGSRLASRLLAAYIAFNAGLNINSEIAEFRTGDVYQLYMIGIYLYLIIGAIKLWRVKELPTRFTDPPQEPAAHH